MCCASDEEEPTNDMTMAGGVDLVATYAESQICADIQEQLKTLSENRYNGRIRNDSGKYATNFFWQLLIVGIRSMVNLLRNPMTSVFQVIYTLELRISYITLHGWGKPDP